MNKQQSVSCTVIYIKMLWVYIYTHRKIHMHTHIYIKTYTFLDRWLFIDMIIQTTEDAYIYVCFQGIL